jgi:hypothetical protein
VVRLLLTTLPGLLALLTWLLLPAAVLATLLITLVRIHNCPWLRPQARTG